MILTFTSCVLIFFVSVLIGGVTGLMTIRRFRVKHRHHFPKWYMPQEHEVRKADKGISYGSGKDLENTHPEYAQEEFGNRPA